MIVATSALTPDDRHPRDIALLRVIAENAPITQQWLADYLAINRSVMVKLIDGLEAHGDVVRDRRLDDRRSYALRTTSTGRRTINRLSMVVRNADIVFSAPLSAAERRRLVSLLQAVVLPHFDPPPPEGLTDLVGFLVTHAYFRVEALGDSRLAPIKLTVRTFVALAILARRAPCSQQDLADGLEIRPAATVELVDELEQLGTVRRSRNPVDRRSYALELSPGGEALLVRAQAIVNAASNEFMARIDVAERSELAELLAKLAGLNGAARLAGVVATVLGSV